MVSLVYKKCKIDKSHLLIRRVREKVINKIKGRTWRQVKSQDATTIMEYEIVINNGLWLLHAVGPPGSAVMPR